jgi:CDP-6-deoxy-D-xylo-4-hexulose-3-dehydrase
MVREADNEEMRKKYARENPELSPDFIFAFPAYNVRNTEIGAVLGRSQLKKLDRNNERRRQNLKLFLTHLDSRKYRTDFEVEGSCNYAFNLIMQKADPSFRTRLENAMRAANIEFRRGSSGGGNQLRQPYLKGIVPEKEYAQYPEIEHVHFYGYYMGNFPELKEEKILALCRFLNSVE